MRSWTGTGNKTIPKLYGALLVAPYCAEKIVSVWLCVSFAQGAVHMTLLGLIGCKGDMVNTGKANFYSGCINWHQKCYFHLESGFISSREGCLGSEQVFAS